MAWADNYIKILQEDGEVMFCPRGNSMTPLIYSGDLVTVTEYGEGQLPQKGDIVLCKVSGTQYLHLVTAVDRERYQISNNHGKVNGWTNINKIYGKVTDVDRN